MTHPLPIDPVDPPIAAIRDLLTASFTPETLQRFCMDRPVFRPIVDGFGPDHGLADMVDRVIEYCETTLLWGELLAEVREVSPRRYERFVAGLTQRGATSSTAPAGADTAILRARLQRLDAVEIESLCLDYFPAVYDRFGRGLRRDEMINLLLDHCRRKPEEATRLASLLK